MALVVKDPPANAGNIKRCGFNPWIRKIPWRAWQPTPVFLPGESYNRGPGGLKSIRSQRVRHDWSNLACSTAPKNKQICNLKPLVQKSNQDWDCFLLFVWMTVRREAAISPPVLILQKLQSICVNRQKSELPTNKHCAGGSTNLVENTGFHWCHHEHLHHEGTKAEGGGQWPPIPHWNLRLSTLLHRKMGCENLMG